MTEQKSDAESATESDAESNAATTNPPDKGTRFDPPALDLILMVQQARMQHDATAKPSQANIGYWVEAKRQTMGKAVTARAGQWIIATSLAEIDALWMTIKTATEFGKLGYKSKAGTLSRQGGTDQVDRVILVKTVDADDVADVARVRAMLIELGVRGELRYERDQPSPLVAD